MGDLRDVLTTFTARYRAAALLRIGLLSSLALAMLAALAWRLSLMQVPPVFSLGAPAVLAAAVVAGAARWVQRRRLFSKHGTAHLDQLLGLQQRLVTAEEFATRSSTSSLYPLLVADAARCCETAQAPKPLTRTSGVLILLMLLLLWPRGGRATQLARQPGLPSPGSPNGSQPGGASPSPTESKPGGASSASTGTGQPPQGQHQSQQQQGQQREQQSQGQRQQSQGQQSQEQQQGRQGQSPQGHGKQGENTSSQDAQGEGKSQRQQRDAGGRQQSHSPSNQGQADGASAAQAQQTGKGSGSKGGQSPGGQEALKGEIQQLLRQVSGELKQLQAQLDNTKSPSQPDAGTGTDAQLYDTAPSELGPSGHTPMAIQLKTDIGEIKTLRPGGGVGEASDAASGDGPKTAAENAQLSETPIEESASVRQTVPPEYVGVFDRLHRQRAQPAQPSEAQ